MANYQRFEVQTCGDVMVLHLADPKLFETLMVSELEDELLAVISESSPKKLLVNFGRVTYCSTSVINGLLRAKKRVVKQGGAVNLCGMRDTIREAYRILNLDGTVFDIYDDIDAGLAAFGGQSDDGDA
jgi:anti-anti-sigma regulatory factor